MKKNILFASILLVASCMSPEEWVAQNNRYQRDSTDVVNTEKYIDEYVVREPARDYDTITIRIKSQSGVAAVVMPDVKYNKGTILTLIGDNMSKNDLTMGWALFNGHYCGTRTSVHRNEIIKVLKGESALEGYMQVHDPWEFSTDDGKTKRWAMTSAIWPSQATNNNYMNLDAEDAKGMMRLGHSFAMHDVNADLTGMSLETLAGYIKAEANEWRNYTGVGPKTMAEPNGDKAYIEASRLTDQICMSVCQARSVGYISRNSNGYTYYYTTQMSHGSEEIHNDSISTYVTDWAQGDCVPDYNNKTHNSLVRFFINNSEAAYQINEQLLDGHINAFGMQGVSAAIADELEKLKTRNDLWVASIDEIWEYYYLKKKTLISTSTVNGETVITLLVPQYSDHQFRDLTLRLDAADVTGVSFSNNVVTGGWKQNEGYCTINVGLETRMYKYITEYLNIVHMYPKYPNIRRDLEYLINLLADGEKKEEYKALYKGLN